MILAERNLANLILPPSHKYSLKSTQSKAIALPVNTNRNFMFEYNLGAYHIPEVYMLVEIMKAHVFTRVMYATQHIYVFNK